MSLSQLSLLDEVEETGPILFYCFMCGAACRHCTTAASLCRQCVKVYGSVRKLFVPPEQIEMERKKYHDLFHFSSKTGLPWTHRNIMHVTTRYTKMGGVPGLEGACNGRWFVSHQQGNGEYWYILNDPLSEVAIRWLEEEPGVISYEVGDYPPPEKWW
jgi:hypothetical protein